MSAVASNVLQGRRSLCCFASHQSSCSLKLSSHVLGNNTFSVKYSSLSLQYIESAIDQSTNRPGDDSIDRMTWCAIDRRNMDDPWLERFIFSSSSVRLRRRRAAYVFYILIAGGSQRADMIRTPSNRECATTECLHVGALLHVKSENLFAASLDPETVALKFAVAAFPFLNSSDSSSQKFRRDRCSKQRQALN